MNHSRIFLIALYTLAFALLMQFFLAERPNNSNVPTGMAVMSIKDDTTVVPNIPHIEIKNHEQESITLLPCDDLKINLNSHSITFQEDAPDFCTPIEILPGSSATIPFNNERVSKLFQNQTGKFVVTWTHDGKEQFVMFTHSEPGFFRKTATTLVYRPIYNTFVGLLTYLPGHSLGWAIIIITLIIRCIILVPQHKMIESQKKLQLIQPKIKAIQKQYKDDQAKLGTELLALYKKEGVNPMGSCLPLLIQMPILLGLYWVISGITDPSNAYHLYSFFKDFSPHVIDPHFFGVDLLVIGGPIAIAFAIALAGVQWVQAKLSFAYTKPSTTQKKETALAKTDEKTNDFSIDPEVMQKMTLYILPVVIGVSALFFPLGVGLYWMIGTLFMIAQQWFVNKKSDKKPAIETPEIVVRKNHPKK